MVVEAVGWILRLMPAVPGKELLIRSVLTPAIRGRGHECIVALKGPGGGKLICNLDDWIPWNVYLYGNYSVEGPYEGFVVKRAARRDVVMDVGANIGYYTVQFARVARGTVYAFEPMSHQFGILQRNLALNRISNVSARRLIVSDVAEVQRIFFAGAEQTGSSSLEIEYAHHHEDVESTTLDDFCQTEGIETVDLVKIDVEGHELRVLRGMERLLGEGRIRDLFVEINSATLTQAGTSADEVCAYLDRVDYRPFSIKTGTTAPYRLGESESLVYFTRAD